MSAPQSKRTWRPVLAGVLQILACLPYIFSALELYFWPRDLPVSAGGGKIWEPIGVLVWVPFILPLVLGSISSLIRKAWGLALIGALLPLVFTVLAAPWSVTSIGTALFYRTEWPLGVCRAIEFSVYAFMVLAAALVVWSRREFTGRSSAGEHLYGPPKGWHRSED